MNSRRETFRDVERRDRVSDSVRGERQRAREQPRVTPGAAAEFPMEDVLR